MTIHHILVTLSAALFLQTPVASPADAPLTDPYEILERHYEVVGGLDMLKRQQTRHSEGTIVLAGLEGRISQWEELPSKSRIDVDLGILRQIYGDNGEFSWEVDTNGKLQIARDEATLLARDVARRLAEYDHLNRESDAFSLVLAGTDTVAGEECYVVEVSNTINENVRREYVSTSSFLLEKSVLIEPDTETHTDYSDYRGVDGALIPFLLEVETLPVGDMQVIRLTHYETDVDIPSDLFEPPADDAEDFRFTEGRSAESVPFEFIENHIFLPVTINRDTSLWILDSGASMTVVDRGFAERIGLSAEGNMTGTGIGNTVDVSFVTLPSYALPGVVFDEQTVAAIDIAELFRRTSGLTISGILGYDFLSRFVTRVDYAGELISFHDPEVFEYEGSGVVLDAPLVGNNFSVPALVDGEYAGRWNLDLGAGGLSFHYPFAEKNGLLDLPGVDRIAFGAGGSLPLRSSRFETIEFAGFVVPDPLIRTPVSSPDGAFGGSELTGNLGNSLFRRFVLHLDYENQRVIVEKGADYERDFPEDRSGLSVWLGRDNEFEVHFVSPGTPAHKAGFQKDDIIRAVNGIDAEHLSGIMALRKLLRAEAGTRYAFEVERDGARETLKLTLRDLY